MTTYVEFNGPVEQTFCTTNSSLPLDRNPDEETCFDEPVEDRLDELAAEFVERYRQGESPTIAEYARRHPDLAKEICDLFPTIAQMEGLKVQIEQDQQPISNRGMITGHVPLSQLGDFRIIREIGRGGMGVVYEAEQMSLGRRVAIKALPLLSVSQPELVRRFQREARTAARLHHTNIVPVFGVGEAEGFHYYVMQLIDGIGLDTFTDDNTSTRSESIASQLMTELDAGGNQNPSADQEPFDATQAPTPGLSVNADGSSDSDSTATATSSLVRTSDSKSTTSSLDDLIHDNSTSLSVPSHPKFSNDIGNTSSATGSVSANLTEDGGLTCTGETSGTHPKPTAEDPAGQASSATRMSGGLSISQIVDIGIQAADGLHYAHAQGTLHRDIKPGNLMLDGNGVVWVTDFGLAKAMEGDDITHTENVVGTVRYMAPEQFRGQTDARNDIYSLGITLYELITGKRAWAATSRSQLINEIMEGQLVPLRKVVADIPRDLETIVLKATAPDVRLRYQTAGELAEDLRRFASDRPVHARRVGPLERLWRWGRRNPVVAGLSLATILSLTMFAVTAAIGYSAEREQRERFEETSDLALEALDRIFEKFAPGDSLATSSSSLANTGNTEAEHAVLSPEAARLLAGLLEFYERLASQSNDDPELLLKCAQARQRVGDIYQRLGKYQAAITAYRVAISDYENLAAFTDSNSTGRFSIVKAGLLNGIGSCELMLAQQSSSQASHNEAMSLLVSLSDANQQQPEVRYEVARTHSLLARRLRPGESVMSEQFDESGKDAARRNRLRPGPDERFGPNGERRPRPPIDDVDSRVRRQHFAAAITILEELATEAPDVARYRFLLALCLRESSQQNEAGINETLNRACQLLETLVDKHPEIPEYRLALAESYAFAEGRPGQMRPEDEALSETSLAMAAEHARQLVEEHPTVPAYTNCLIHVYSRLSAIQERRANQLFGPEHRRLMLEAERNLRSALELQESLIRREPEVATFHLWAARFRNSIARMLRLQNRITESRQMSDYAIERLDEYPTSVGDLAAKAEINGQLHHSLSLTLRGMGLIEDAVDAMLTAQDQFDLAAEERARQPSR